MDERSEQPIDPEKYKALLPTNPGIEEGVTAEVEQLRRDHQLPDADIDFEALARSLANIDLADVKFPVPLSIADADPGVKAMHQKVEQKFSDHHRDVGNAIQRESLGSLNVSIAVCGADLNNLGKGLSEKLSGRTDKEALAILAKAAGIKAAAEAAGLPLATAKERFDRSEISEVDYYEIFFLARAELKELVHRLRKIADKA